MEVDDTAQTQIRVNFTTKDTDIALPEDTAPVLVPTGKEEVNEVN